MSTDLPGGRSIEDGYPAWVGEHDTLDAADVAAIRAGLVALREPPVISLLLPVGHAADGALRETLTSIRDQLYPHWEAILVGEPVSATELPQFAAYDPRVRIISRDRVADPATAANMALAEADGLFVALLTEGDRLAPQALYEVAVELARYPATELLYTDEDRINLLGARSAPRFKTGWDADLLLGQDYIGGLAVYARAAVDGCGGWREGFGAASGYDLALRATGRMMPDRIRHLPAVLYHRPDWHDLPLHDRMLSADAAAARRAVAEFLGPAARIERSSLLPSCHRIVWPVPVPAPLVSIIMPTRDLAAFLVPAAWGVLLRTDYPEFELLIVDNDSTEAVTEQALRDLAGAEAGAPLAPPWCVQLRRDQQCRRPGSRRRDCGAAEQRHRCDRSGLAARVGEPRDTPGGRRGRRPAAL